jgi:hypothetical protein
VGFFVVVFFVVVGLVVACLVVDCSVGAPLFNSTKSTTIVQNKTRKLFGCMMLSILIYDCVYNEMLLFYLKVIIQMVAIFVCQLFVQNGYMMGNVCVSSIVKEKLFLV